jgi:hypothetical protein
MYFIIFISYADKYNIFNFKREYQHMNLNNILQRKYPGWIRISKIRKFLHGKVIQGIDFGHFWYVHFSKVPRDFRKKPIL